MTIHLSSLDEEEHLHGPFSAEANADLERLDSMVARLIARERANNTRSVVIVVSDHGFADISHELDLGIAFVKSGLMSGRYAQHQPWQAQPWALGSMFAIMLHDPADDLVREKVKALLDMLAADPANGVEAVLDPQAVAAAGGVPDAAFVVTLRKGFAAGTAITGELTRVPSGRGTHGFDPRTTPEMQSSFFASGQAIPRGHDLGTVDMRQIAPTVAGLLGISMNSQKAGLLTPSPSR